MKINHITLLVSNREKSLDFYIGILGLKRKDVGKHIWVEVGESYIHLTENSGGPIPGTFYHFAISTRLEELRDKLVKNKSEFEDKESQIFLRDPDGNLVEFIDENDNFFK